MADYELSHKAKMDLRNIYQYGVSQHGEKQADQYYKKLFDCFDKIAENRVNSIYYCIVDDNIKIMRILGRQDVAEVL